MVNIRKYFSLKVSVVYFWKSQWERFDPQQLTTPISPFYMLYRIFFMIWVVTALVINLTVDAEDSTYFFLYFTYLTLTIECIYGVFSMVHLIVELVKKYLRKRDNIATGQRTALKADDTSCSPLCIVHILLMYHTYTFTPIVTLVFWSILTEEQKAVNKRCAYKQAANQFAHTFNSIISVIDSFIVSAPVKFFHFVYVYGFLCCYIIFTCVYELSGGPVPDGQVGIYGTFNWIENPGATSGVMVGVLVGNTITFLIFCWGICRLRQFIAKKAKVGAHQFPSKMEPEPQLQNDDINMENDENETQNSTSVTSNEPLSSETDASKISHNKD